MLSKTEKMKEEFETAKAWIEKYEFCRFEGEISDKEKIKSFLQNLENYLKETGREPPIMRKIFNIAVEVAQNVGFHTEQVETMPNFQHKITASIFEKECKILGSNLVKNEAIEKITKKIEDVNLYADNPEKLRDLYKSTLCFGSYLGRGQPNFRFIDIVRKTSNKLLYHFEKIDEEHSYFSVIATVKAAI